MWVNLFRAEWRKIMGNRWATGCMIGIFPMIAILVTMFGLLAVALSSNLREGLNTEPAAWTDIAMIAWQIPNNPLGLGLLIGFTAMVFAGENQWNTWKLIVPRSRRVPLIVMKFITVALFVVIAFALMSLLLTIGVGLLHWAAGATYGPSINGTVLSDFAQAYGVQVLTTFISTIIAAGITALAAMVTRTILGSVIVGFVVAVGQTLLILPLALLAGLFNMDVFLHLFRFIPTYNLLNLSAWFNHQWFEGPPPDGIEMPSGIVVVDSQLFSEVILICWVIGLIALTAYLFQRQDITN